MNVRVYCARELQSDVASTESFLKVRVSEHSGSFRKYRRLKSIMMIRDRFNEHAHFVASKMPYLKISRVHFSFNTNYTRIHR